MARGPIVTDQVQVLIASVYKKHPKWKAPEVRNEVSFLVRKNNPKLPSNWPSLSTVQKILATVRKNMKELLPSPRDKPWSTASMVKYPIPPEALPSVLQTWAWVRENTTGIFTIRQAQWVARLYAITKDIGLLAFMSRNHATMEFLSETTEVSYIDCHNVDLTLFGLVIEQEITPERQKRILRLSEEQWLALKEAEEFVDTHNESEPDDMIIDGIIRVIDGGVK
jgi:hypothetical protein